MCICIRYKWISKRRFFLLRLSRESNLKDRMVFHSSLYLFIYLFCSSLFSWLPFREDEKFNCSLVSFFFLVRDFKFLFCKKKILKKTEKGFHHAIIVCSFDDVEGNKRNEARAGATHMPRDSGFERKNGLAAFHFFTPDSVRKTPVASATSIWWGILDLMWT